MKVNFINQKLNSILLFNIKINFQFSLIHAHCKKMETSIEKQIKMDLFICTIM